MKNTPAQSVLIRTAGIGILSILVGCQNSVKQELKPNVLFILADDFGYHDMGISGSNFYETPNLDQLGQESMIFTNGYAACQVCSPSRASLLTGQFPARHGITDWIGAKTGESWRSHERFNKLLPAEYVHNLDTALYTLPEALRENDYKTFFAGKWHLGAKDSWPEDHGFDVNIGGWDAGSPMGGYFSPYKNPNLPNRVEGENLSIRLAKETADFIQNNHPQKTGKAFFAYLSFYAVHGPIQTTKEKWEKYRNKAELSGIREEGFEKGKYLPIRNVQDNPVYAGLVEQMDDAVGLILDSLKAFGLDENTIVIFTSDNGGVAAGDAFATSNKPLRAGKGTPFEGGIREPFFIKVPWMNHNGEICDEPVSGVDFYPTILDLTGIELLPGEHKDGQSLLPLLENETLPERALIWHYPHYGNQGGEPSSILRRSEWKLIHFYEDGRDELYNLNRDISESENVIEENQELAEALKKELFTYLETVGARFPVSDPEYDSLKEKQYLDWVFNEKWKSLEKQRLHFLSPDFDPGNNWWGSRLTRD